MRKNIDLPASIVLKLQRLANIERRKLKPFMEMVLENYALKNHKDKNIQLTITDKAK